MNTNKYLSNGTIVNKHYEIIDVLGEDDFEILYLAKSLHRKGSFFVLKELFLESFSTRNGNLVETIPEALGVFEKQKKHILQETQTLQKKSLREEIKILSTFEENNTVYTCMAYTPNSKLEAYLQFQPKENTLLPMLDELNNPKTKGKGKIIALSLLAFILLFAGIIFFINKNAENVMQKRDIPLLKEHKKSLKKQETNNSVTKEVTTEKQTSDKKATDDNYSETQPIDKNSLWKENFSLENTIAEVEENNTKEEEIVQEKKLELPSKNNESNQTAQKKATDITKVNENKIATPEPKDDESNNSDTKQAEPFSKEEVNAFLEKFIELSAKGTAKELASLYEKRVDRYFKFRRIGSSKVERSIKAYNRRWSKRNFTLVGFKILKKYKKNNRDYCKVKTDTKWIVSNTRGKTRKGRSKGIMLLVHGEDGIKIKAIYGTK
jgi:hypothetical protein